VIDAERLELIFLGYDKLNANEHVIATRMFRRTASPKANAGKEPEQSF
jgi:hypothetical protein